MASVRDIIEANRERFLAEFEELLRYPSVSGNRQALAEAAKWIEQQLMRLGAEVRMLDTGGGPAVVFGEVGAGTRSLLSYTHYDVQPADPLPAWNSEPFNPTARDGKLFARGVGDDKGDTSARIQAIEVYRQAYGDLPLRIKFFVEGEEEVGSPHLAQLAAKHGELLHADGVLWEGGQLDEEERYTLYGGVKGIQYLELRTKGAAYDLHSSYAPIVPNPAWRLVEALSTLRDREGRIKIDGFMDHVRPPSEAELAYMRRIPFAGERMRRNWQIPAFLNDISDQEAVIAFLTQPTCTICGLLSGFTAPGEQTVLPSSAMAKIDMRLVPDLTPELALDLLRAHLDRRGFTDVEIVPYASMVPVRPDMQAQVVQVAVDAARAVYGGEPVVYPSHGGSGPMAALVSGVGTPGVISAGVGYWDMRMHSPNENIRLDDYFRHIEFLVEFMRRFAAA